MKGVTKIKYLLIKVLREFIARSRGRRLLDLVGTLEWEESYDYKAERSRRSAD
jgi:hypothetical protein